MGGVVVGASLFDTFGHSTNSTAILGPASIGSILRLNKNDFKHTTSDTHATHEIRNKSIHNQYCGRQKIQNKHMKNSRHKKIKQTIIRKNSQHIIEHINKTSTSLFNIQMG